MGPRPPDIYPPPDTGPNPIRENGEHPTAEDRALPVGCTPCDRQSTYPGGAEAKHAPHGTPDPRPAGQLTTSTKSRPDLLQPGGSGHAGGAEAADVVLSVWPRAKRSLSTVGRSTSPGTAFSRSVPSDGMISTTVSASTRTSRRRRNPSRINNASGASSRKPYRSRETVPRYPAGVSTRQPSQRASQSGLEPPQRLLSAPRLLVAVSDTATEGRDQHHSDYRSNDYRSSHQPERSDRGHAS